MSHHQISESRAHITKPNSNNLSPFSKEDLHLREQFFTRDDNHEDTGDDRVQTATSKMAIIFFYNRISKAFRDFNFRYQIEIQIVLDTAVSLSTFWSKIFGLTTSGREMFQPVLFFLCYLGKIEKFNPSESDVYSSHQGTRGGKISPPPLK